MRWAALLSLLAVICVADQATAAPGLQPATTPVNAERLETIPITRRAGAEPRSVISLRSGRLPAVHEGDRLRAVGEVQVTNTCVEKLPRCIGRRYDYSPRISAWMVLARAADATGGSAAKRISARERVRCGQHRPNRNHHCVLTFAHAGLDVPAADRRPCRSSRCYVNVVVAAHHPSARKGNRLIIGADRPDGSVAQRKGGIGALVIREGADVRRRTISSSHRVHRSVRMDASGGWTSIYSVKLRRLQRGDVVVARASQRLDISGIPHAVWDSTQLVLAQRPGKVRAGHIARRSARWRPELDPANGFNCTHGPSAYQSPCLSRKAGQVAIRRRPMDRRGRPVPLYVNLISRGFAKLAQKSARRAQYARIKPGGGVHVTRYREAR